MNAFIRFQSAVPNRRGRYPGVFALANGLRADGRLSDPDAALVGEWNERAEAAYADPSTVDPECYDPLRNPGARAWFKDDRHDLISLAQRYLDLLDRYRIAWNELRTARPGRVVYEDAAQVVAVPWSYPEDWPFAPRRENGSA